MFEEPYRWMEAVSTRHSYVQEKLKLGQPVLSVPFDEGVLVMGFAPQPGKIFEIYDRIALGGVGHPADVERLRMTLLEMAHLEGFNRSARDVTLARLLQFGIAPALKQNFSVCLGSTFFIRFKRLSLPGREGSGLEGPESWRSGLVSFFSSLLRGSFISMESTPFLTRPFCLHHNRRSTDRRF